MRKSGWLVTLLATGLALPLAGPTIAQASDKLRREFHQTYPLSAEGRVSLENVNGDVHIATWDRLEVKVDALKSAGSEERLEETKISVSAQTDEVRIKTEYPHHFFGNNGPARVDYDLIVPRRARLDKIDLVNGSLEIEGASGEVAASSVNGRVRANGLSGEVHLSAVNGRIEAGFDRPDISRDVSLESVNGPVVLTLPPDASTEVRASTVNGGISNDFGLESKRTGFVGHELEGVIGKGGGHIQLSDVNGSIEIRRASSVAN